MESRLSAVGFLSENKDSKNLVSKNFSLRKNWLTKNLVDKKFEPKGRPNFLLTKFLNTKVSKVVSDIETERCFVILFGFKQKPEPVISCYHGDIMTIHVASVLESQVYDTWGTW